MKRVLITGASGFIGRNCLQPLIESGFEVHAVGRTAFQADVEMHFHRADVLDPGSRIEVLGKVRPSHLLHAAWDLSAPDYMTSSQNYKWAAASLDLTREFAEQGGERVLHIGSCYEYEWRAPVLDEATPLVPATHYGKAKARLFELARDFGEAFGIGVAWSRLFFLYGPHEGRRRLIPSVITALLSDREAPTSDGSQERDYMYSVDVGRALVALLQSEVIGAVNIGTGHAIPIADLVRATARLCGRTDLLRLGALAGRPGEARKVEANTDRLRQEVDWSEFTEMEQALEETIDWWREVLAT